MGCVTGKNIIGESFKRLLLPWLLEMEKILFLVVRIIHQDKKILPSLGRIVQQFKRRGGTKLPSFVIRYRGVEGHCPKNLNDHPEVHVRFLEKIQQA
jgi:hypothetical protein